MYFTMWHCAFLIKAMVDTSPLQCTNKCLTQNAFRIELSLACYWEIYKISVIINVTNCGKLKRRETEKNQRNILAHTQSDSFSYAL